MQSDANPLRVGFARWSGLPTTARWKSRAAPHFVKRGRTEAALRLAACVVRHRRTGEVARVPCPDAIRVGPRRASGFAMKTLGCRSGCRSASPPSNLHLPRKLGRLAAPSLPYAHEARLRRAMCAPKPLRRNGFRGARPETPISARLSAVLPNCAFPLWRRYYRPAKTRDEPASNRARNPARMSRSSHAADVWGARFFRAHLEAMNVATRSIQGQPG